MSLGGMSPHRSRGDRRVPANVPANDVPAKNQEGDSLVMVYAIPDHVTRCMGRAGPARGTAMGQT